MINSRSGAMTQPSHLFQRAVLQLEEDFQKKFPYKNRPATWDQQSLADRIRRSLSWLERAALTPRRDKPPRFVDLWIALNALYGVKPDRFPDERGNFRNFIRKLNRIDSRREFLVPSMSQGHIQNLSFELVDNQYLWREFWQKKSRELRENRIADLKIARASLREKDVVKFYACVFERLYILRNQIFHGSSSATTKKSEDALKPAIIFLEETIPTFIRVMMNCGSGKDWPSLPFPGRDTPQFPA